MISQHSDTELHKLFDGRLTIFQKKNGYRFSIDSILLGNFAAERTSGKVADLGTGSGILPVLLARSDAVKKITGIEIQEELAELAIQNIVFNKCEEKVSIIKTDIKNLKTYFAPETFDAVVTNPPFYPADSGRINPDEQNAVARHELHGTLQDFVTAAAFLVKLSGKFIAIYLSSRIADLISQMRLKNIEPKVLQFVHARRDEPATMVLVEGIKRAGLEAKILPPLILYENDANYTEEVKRIFSNI